VRYDLLSFGLDPEERIDLCGHVSDSNQQLARVTLQGSEAQRFVSLVLQDPLHGSIADAAFAIVKQDGAAL
jgi:hypothetical protein